MGWISIRLVGWPDHSPFCFVRTARVHFHRHTVLEEGQCNGSTSNYKPAKRGLWLFLRFHAWRSIFYHGFLHTHLVPSHSRCQCYQFWNSKPTNDFRGSDYVHTI